MDQAIRFFKLDLREKVHGIWDDNVPVVRHAVIEATGIDKKLDHKILVDCFTVYCEIMKFNIVRKFEHCFTPHGVSLVCILEESHIAVHAWPEKGYLHVDIVTCTKEEIDWLNGLNEFKKIFKPISIRLIDLTY